MSDVYFLDTEFHERGPGVVIELISMALVSLDGREYYAEAAEYDKKSASPWLQVNVLPHLKSDYWRKHRGDIACDLRQFVTMTPETKPQFWAYFADYDWVLFAQTFGTMMDLPPGFPMLCNDLRQLANMLGVKRDDYPKQASGQHDALADARWNRDLYLFLKPLALAKGLVL